jgi:hypothetical protein
MNEKISPSTDYSLSTHRSPGRMWWHPAATNHNHPAGIMISASHFQLPSLLR